jgi:hypothetical protein
MAHPVVPIFPANPVIGQVFVPAHGGSWTYTELGWVKTIIVLTSDYPIYNGLLVETKN